MHMVSDAERNHKLLLLVTFDWTLCTKCMYNSGHRICALCTMQCNMMQRETTVCCSWWPQGWLEAAETPSSSPLVIIVLSVISAITFVTVIIVIFTKMLHSYTLWTQYRSQAPPALVSKLSVLHCQSLVLHINQPSLLSYNTISFWCCSAIIDEDEQAATPQPEVSFLRLPLINCSHKSFGYCY